MQCHPLTSAGPCSSPGGVGSGPGGAVSPSTRSGFSGHFFRTRIVRAVVLRSGLPPQLCLKGDCKPWVSNQSSSKDKTLQVLWEEVKKYRLPLQDFLFKRDKRNVSLWIREHCCYFVNLFSGFAHRFVVHKAADFTNYRVRAVTESWITECNRRCSNAWTSRCSGSRTAGQGSKDPSCYKQAVGLHLLDCSAVVGEC